MKTFWKTVVACAAVASLGAAGCEERNDERINDAENRAENDAENLGDRFDRSVDRVEEEARQTGDRLEQAGQDMTDGVTFEVAKVDKEARTIELRRANTMIGVTDRKDLQAGEQLMLTFDELEKHVEGDKSAEEIAEELHVGENVDVFMDDNRKIQKITY